MIEHKVQDAVNKAIEKLKAERRPLAFGDVHERSTAHRLAVHLDRLFRGWDVDCEYNRDESITKRLAEAGCADPITSKIVLPYIIVHKRRKSKRGNNLLVIEMKNGASDDKCDDMKLRYFTDDQGDYQYQLGLYIHVNHGRFDLKWYKNGTLFSFPSEAT